jgi:hypothetical protein
MRCSHVNLFLGPSLRNFIIVYSQLVCPCWIVEYSVLLLRIWLVQSKLSCHGCAIVCKLSTKSATATNSRVGMWYLNFHHCPLIFFATWNACVICKCWGCIWTAGLVFLRNVNRDTRFLKKDSWAAHGWKVPSSVSKFVSGHSVRCWILEADKQYLSSFQVFL